MIVRVPAVTSEADTEVPYRSRHAQDSPLEVTTNDAVFAYAIASNHRRRLAAAIVPTPYAAKDTA